MAEQTIDIPGVGPVSFPAEMSDADIAAAAGRLHGDAQAAAAQRRATAEPAGSGLERAVSGFARTNPLTGLYNLLTTNPLTTLRSIGASHVDEGRKTIDAVKRLLGGDPLALSEAVGHGVATLTPLVGPAAAHAGELIGSGDVAGGLGEATGLLAGVPSVGGRAVELTGRGAAKIAPLVKTPARYGGAASILHGNPLAGLTAMAVPPLLEYGGRALEGVGKGIRESAPGPALSLRRLLGHEPVDPYTPNISGYRGPSSSDVAVGAAESAVDVDRYAPNESGYGGPSASDVSVGAPESAVHVDRYAPNEPGYSGPSATDVSVGAPYEPLVDRYAPNVSGYDPLAPASDVAVGEPYGPAVVESLRQRSGAPRAVARAPKTALENLQSRVLNDDALPGGEEGWITPGETLKSVGAPEPTGDPGFWRGLRRGDLWPSLQDELLATAEGPAARTRPGRTGPSTRDARGRLTKK